jgi:hypothetical protein
MAERHAEGSSVLPLPLNTLLAFVILASSVWLVSHKLTSTRPAASADGARTTIVWASG